MDKHPFFSHLRCRECGRHYGKEAVHVCEFDFGPLEAAYDYDAIGKSLTREKILSRPHSMWRYRELLPIENEPSVGLQTGFTPLIRARRSAVGETPPTTRASQGEVRRFNAHRSR